MRKLNVIFTDLDAAGAYYATLEHRLSNLEEQVMAVRSVLNQQAEKVKLLMHERDEAEAYWEHRHVD